MAEDNEIETPILKPTLRGIFFERGKIEGLPYPIFLQLDGKDGYKRWKKSRWKKPIG